MKGAALLLLVVASIFSGWNAYALNPGMAIEAARSAEGKALGDYLLRDQDGRDFNVSELRGKPFVLSFIYTSCPHTCSPMTASLAEAFKKAGADFGGRFTALTVGLDPERDTPEAMRSYGGLFTKDFGPWRFASADKSTVEALAGDTGLYFRKVGDGFEHPNMAAVIGPDGKVLTHVFGPDFSADDVARALTLAYEGRKSPEPPAPKGLIERLKLLCYTYDEKTGTYRPDYYVVVAGAVVLVLQASVASVVFYVFYSARKRRRSAGGKK